MSAAVDAASRPTTAAPVPKFKFDTSSTTAGGAGQPNYYQQIGGDQKQQDHNQQQQEGGDFDGPPQEGGISASKIVITLGAIGMASLCFWQLFIRKKPTYAEGKPTAPAPAAGAADAPTDSAPVKKPELTKTFEYYFGPPGQAALDNMLLFSGRVNQALAQDIAKYLGIGVSQTSVKTFADGEIGIQINENIRGKDCFIVQSISKPVNDNLMELLLMISTMRRASAQSITAGMCIDRSMHPLILPQS